MATIIRILQSGKPVRSGLEVSIHWSGGMSGYSKYKTGQQGEVYVDENLISGYSRNTDNIYVENPRGGYSLKFPKISVEKGKELPLDLDYAERQ